MKVLKNATKGYGFKILVLAGLILLLLIPTGMIKSIIHERSERSFWSENTIMESWGSRLEVVGPTLRVPCIEYTEIKTRNLSGAEITETKENPFILWLTPKKLNMKINLGTETKKRGIFSVPLFAGTMELSGFFDSAAINKELKANQKAILADAELIIAFSDQKGIRSVEHANWNTDKLRFLPGNRGSSFDFLNGGIYSSIQLNPDAANNFDISLKVQGGKSLRMVPLGEDSSFFVKTDWPSPSFQGAYLPQNHTIEENGFEASWNVSYLSLGIPLSWRDAELTYSNIDSAQFGVNFFKPLDHYDVNIRAVKYALLFLIMPFLSMFLMEFFSQKEIHVIQYLLAGIGNIIFYLLLLSLSEHLPFSVSYLITALATGTMMSLYIRSIMEAWAKFLLMFLIMSFCYAFLYFTLQSEDWALLIGSIGAFTVTALVMFLTRKVNWSGAKKTQNDLLPESTLEDIISKTNPQEEDA